jgi:hypothetical protein
MMRGLKVEGVILRDRKCPAAVLSDFPDGEGTEGPASAHPLGSGTLNDFPDDEGDRRRSMPFLTRSVLLSDFPDDEGTEGVVVKDTTVSASRFSFMLSDFPDDEGNLGERAVAPFVERLPR